MNATEAIEHLTWKFTNSNSKASKKDKQALNAIISSLKQQNNVVLNNNLNLCKLLIHTFKVMCLREATRNVPQFKVGMTEKEFKSFKYDNIDYLIIYSRLRDVFKMDAKSHINSLHSELKGLEIQRLIDSNKLTIDTMRGLITDKEVNINVRKMCSEFIDNN